MNQALFPASVSVATRGARPSARQTRRASRDAWTSHDDAARNRRLRALFGLLSLYTAALLVVIALSDGADLGCILVGVAAHSLYAAHRTFASWRDAAQLEDAKARTVARLHLRMA